MSYVLAPKGEIVAYPYSLEQLRRDNPDVSFPREPGEWLGEWGVHQVTPVEIPVASSIEKDITEGQPTLVKDVWTQVWQEVGTSPEQLAARQRRAAEAAMRDSVKADSFVSSFLGMTPAEVAAHIKGAPNTIAGMKALTTKLALMVLVLARREFK